MISVGAQLVIQLIGSSDKVMFTGDQDAALLHDVGGKTAQHPDAGFPVPARLPSCHPTF